MILETGMDQDCYQDRWFTDCVFLEPDHLLGAVNQLTEFLNHTNIPKQSRFWTCFPDRRGFGWRVTVQYTFAYYRY